jgi:hypothetical protein
MKQYAGVKGLVVGQDVDWERLDTSEEVVKRVIYSNSDANELKQISRDEGCKSD